MYSLWFVLLIILSGVINLIVLVIMALRLKVLYSMSGARAGLMKICNAMIIASTTNSIAPYGTGNLIVRPLILKKTSNLPYEKSLTINIIEYVLEIIVGAIAIIICIYFIGSIYLSPSYLILSFSALILLFAIFYIKKSVILTERLLNFTSWLPGRLKNFLRKKKIIKKRDIVNAISIIQNSRNKGRNILIIFSLSVLILIILPFSLLVFFEAFEVTVNYFQVFIIFWLPFLAGRFLQTPGGIGVRDVGMIYLLTYFGVPPLDATTATILFRLFTIVFISCFGIAASFKTGFNILKLRKSRKIS